MSNGATREGDSTQATLRSATEKPSPISQARASRTIEDCRLMDARFTASADAISGRAP
jgi:hypothetical protein